MKHYHYNDFFFLSLNISPTSLLIPVSALALLQGLTEFLPISSSGHLLVLSSIFVYYNHTFSRVWGLFGNLTLHVGTLLAAIAYFLPALNHDLRPLLRSHHPRSRAIRRLWLAVLTTTILTGLVGLLIHDRVESLFHKPSGTIPMFTLTGLVLLLTPRFRGQLETPSSTRHALWIGFVIGIAQCFALLPGISRSGLTIAAGLAVGLTPGVAFRFSFYTGIPLMAAAWLYDLLFKASRDTGAMPWFIYGWGILLAAVTGWFALRWLERWTIQYKLHWFGFYCLLLALTIFTVTILF